MSRTLPSPGANAHDTDYLRLNGWGLAFILAALTACRIWAASHLGLVPDETYYWLWSRVPSWGYYDHPPMIAWWIWLSTRIFGPTPLAIRLLPVLSVLVVSAAVYGTSRELLPERKYAHRSALWLNAMFLIGGGAIFATPDAPSIMFWALAVWLLARIRARSEPYLWLVFGLVAGLGSVSKYTNLFLGLGVVLWLLTDRNARKWLSSPWLYAGGFIALVVFIPVIFWNAGHHWVSFAKQFGRIGNGHFTLRYLGEFLLAQFGLLNPLIAIFGAIALVAAWRSGDRNAGSTAGFLVVLTLPLVAYMVFHSLHGRVQGNWPAPIYPAVAILAATAVNETTGVHLKRLARYVVPVGVGLPLLAFAYFGTARGGRLPFASPADLLSGWPGLARKVDDVRQGEGAKWIATADYGLTAELEYHTGGKGLVQEVIDRDRYSYGKPDSSLAKEPALLVLRGRDRNEIRILNCFKTAIPAGAISRSAGDRIVESYRLFKVSGGPSDILSSGCP
jgi:4-amino-4-deoxy-L-arabinose transferase-like glycosyltransferase